MLDLATQSWPKKWPNNFARGEYKPKSNSYFNPSKAYTKLAPSIQAIGILAENTLLLAVFGL